MKSLFLNPVIVFISVWGLVVFSDFIGFHFFDNDFYRLKIETYTLISFMAFLWIFGYFLSTCISKQIYMIKNPFDNRLARNHSFVLNVFVFFMMIYLLIKAFDHYLIVGVDFLYPVGIMKYRIFLTMDGGQSNFPFLSLLNYFFFFFPAMIVTLYFSEQKINFFSVFFSCCFFVAYLYLSTARSSVFFSLLIAFFVFIHYRFKIRYFLYLACILFLVFGVLGSLVGKPGFDKLFFYFLSPIHAFDLIYSKTVEFDPGFLSFRFLQPLLVKLEIIDVSLQYIPNILTPKPTNVFTVFGVYYLDYGIFGLCIFLFIFSFLTGVFYNMYRYRNSSRSILIISLSYTLIVLGVFYDYYTSTFVVYSAFFYFLFLFPAFKVKFD